MRVAPWHPIDRVWITSAMRSFLDEAGGLLSTPRTVDSLVGCGMQRAAQGDPCLIGVEDGIPLGFLFWYGLDSVDFPNPTLYACGSYVAPAHRHHGVGRALRAHGTEMARKAGYKRIVYQVSSTNQRGLDVYIAAGAWPTIIQMEALL